MECGPEILISIQIAASYQADWASSVMAVPKLVPTKLDFVRYKLQFRNIRFN